MIAREQITFTAQGDSFIPSKVDAPYSKAHDPGAIGERGRYTGMPIPYGVADFDVPDEEKEKIAYLHRIVMPLLPAMRSAGAEEFRLHITYRYENQCAIGFSKEEIKMIAELECDVPIDCWQDEVPTER
jgi:hypothetical protein